MDENNKKKRDRNRKKARVGREKRLFHGTRGGGCDTA